MAEMCEYCAGLMHKQGRLTDALAMAEQVRFFGFGGAEVWCARERAPRQPTSNHGRRTCVCAVLATNTGAVGDNGIVHDKT